MRSWFSFMKLPASCGNPSVRVDEIGKPGTVGLGKAQKFRRRRGERTLLGVGNSRNTAALGHDGEKAQIRCRTDPPPDAVYHRAHRLFQRQKLFISLERQYFIAVKM